MRSFRRALAPLASAFLLALLLAVPSSASARSGLDLMVHLPSHNGYTISVGGYETTAFIAAGRSTGSPTRTAASSTYLTRGKVTPTSIEADFGELGHVSLRFHASGPAIHTKPQRHCIGPDHYTIREGVYVGSVQFRGEGGYVSARAHRIKGKEKVPGQLICFGSIDSILRESGIGAGPKKKKPKVTRLVAGHREAVTATYLEASHERGVTVFRAASQHTEGRLAIYRTAYVRAPGAAFSASASLASAKLAPPAPFSGTGSRVRGPQGAKLWTGSLSVTFPGQPDVPLTGPQFQTQLTRSW
jgi:hypothetical protein